MFKKLVKYSSVGLLVLCLWPLNILFGQEQQSRIISGIVFDGQAGPLIGATVFIKETGEGTVSDVKGYFELRIPANKQVHLLISFTGTPLTIKTRKNKTFYKININPNWNGSIRVGLGAVHFNQRSAAKESSFSFHIGSIVSSRSFGRFRFGGGINYRFIQHNDLLINLYLIESPFFLEYKLPAKLYLTGGLKLDFILNNKNTVNVLNPEKLFTLIHFGLGFETGKRVNIESQVDYSLKPFTENTHLWHFGLNTIYRLN